MIVSEDRRNWYSFKIVTEAPKIFNKYGSYSKDIEEWFKNCRPLFRVIHSSARFPSRGFLNWWLELALWLVEGAYIWIQTKLSDIPDSEVKKSIQFYVAHHLRKIKKECGICPSRRLLEHSDQGTVHCVGYFLFHAKFLNHFAIKR